MLIMYPVLNHLFKHGNLIANQKLFCSPESTEGLLALVAIAARTTIYPNDPFLADTASSSHFARLLHQSTDQSLLISGYPIEPIVAEEVPRWLNIYSKKDETVSLHWVKAMDRLVYFIISGRLNKLQHR